MNVIERTKTVTYTCTLNTLFYMQMAVTSCCFACIVLFEAFAL